MKMLSGFIVRTSSGCQAVKGSCEGQVHSAVSRLPAKARASSLTYSLLQEQGGQCVGGLERKLKRERLRAL